MLYSAGPVQPADTTVPPQFGINTNPSTYTVINILYFNMDFKLLFKT